MDEPSPESQVRATAHPLRPEQLSPQRYIVGMGASAGGLEALEAFFRHMPDESGLSFVIVQHLSPDFKSLMHEILARYTTMPIYIVEDGMIPSPNTVYLMPAQTEITFSQGRLRLFERKPTQTLSLPIDRFFQSLAHEAGEKAIGIILSGTGSDGSRGIIDIHKAGGFVLVQDNLTAKFDGMPRSSRDTGLADIILAPEQMPHALLNFMHNPLTGRRLPPTIAHHDETPFDTLLQLLWEQCGIDLTHYKQATIRRRIERRLALDHQYDLATYVDHLQAHPEDLNRLYQDLLIGVTHFFRDWDAFEYLERAVIPQLFQRYAGRRSLRVWVAGCTTGEEAYSLAMLLHEHAKKQSTVFDIIIFATDVYQASLDVASVGVYSAESLAGLPAERLSRYFLAEPAGGYRVAKELRQMVVFARHDVIRDAPFRQLDFIACRNLLIYLEPSAQQRVLRHFRFALNMDGILFLGPSESLGEVTNDFVTLDERWKIFCKRSGNELPLETTVASVPARLPRFPTLPSLGQTPSRGAEIHLRRFYDALLDVVVPAGLLVTGQRKLMHVFGEAGRFLQPRQGPSSDDILDIIHPDLESTLGVAITQASQEHRTVVYKGVGLHLSEQQCLVTLTVMPLTVKQENVPALFIRLDVDESPAVLDVVAPPAHDDDVKTQRIRILEMDLQQTRETLQATVEKLAASNQELRVSNEEMVAANEELQTINEELQSVNEELYTVNAEYQTRNQQLVDLNNDTNNLLRSTDIGVVFLTPDFCIRKFTPAISHALNLMPQDVGRPLSHFVSLLDISSEALMELLAQVLHTHTPVEREVRNHTNTCFLMRIQPFLTETDDVVGTVVTLVDISAQKQTESELRRFRAALEITWDCVFLIDYEQMRFVDVNATACTSLGYSREELLQMGVPELRPMVPRQEVVQQLGTLVNGHQGTTALESVYRRKDGSYMPVEVSVRAFESEGRQYVLTIARDITERQQAQAILRRFRTALDTSAESVFLIDPEQRRFIDVNTTACATLGYSRDELLHLEFLDVVPLASNPDGAQQLAAVMRNGQETVVWEALSRCKDGSTLPVEISLRAFEAEDRPYVVAVARDISERYQNEVALRSSEERYRSLVTALNAVVWTMSPEATFVGAQDGWEAFTGQSWEAYRERGWLEAFHADDRAAVLAQWERAMASGTLLEVAGRLWHAEQQQHHHVRLRAAPLRHPDGSLREWIGTVDDVEDEEQSERLLQEAHDELEQRVIERTTALEQSKAEIDAFAYVASHDLKAPLRAIDNLARWIAEDAGDDLPDTAHRHLQTLRQRVTRLERLLDDLLDYSRAGQDQAAIEVVDSGALVTGILDLLAPPPTFSVTVASDMPTFTTAKVPLEQVFRNLIGNAIKHHNRADGLVAVKAYNRGKMWEFVVEDDGPGIPQDYYERIFQMFQTLKPRDQVEGSGIGLAVVRKLVTRGGGTITVESVEGQGACFRFTWPHQESSQE
jgi:two-component system CheB/CheR fusion protein